MLSRIYAVRSPPSDWLCCPPLAMAQTVIAHALTPTASSMAAPAGPAKATTHEHADGPVQARCRVALLQSRNTLPSGAFALPPSVTMGSTDGVHHDMNPGSNVPEPDAYGNATLKKVRPSRRTRRRAPPRAFLGTTTTAADSRQS